MRKGIIQCLLLLTMTVCAVTSTYAVAPGFYIGLFTGPATNAGSVQEIQGIPGAGATAKPTSQQWGTRLYIGNKISQYAGVEGGLTYFTGVQFDTGNATTCSGTQMRVRDFDVVGKGEFPFYSFSLYGKAGAALVYQTTSGDLNSPAKGDMCGKSTYLTKVRPTASIGVSYDLTQNWVTDLSFNSIFIGKPLNNVAIFALGISYHFVDIYCGQFLC